MRNAVLMMMVLGAIVARDCATQHAFADGAGVVHHGKKVHHGYHRPPCLQYDRCGAPIGCPDGTCYSLYGAYPPYGGSLYWSRYTLGGWGRPW